MELTGAQILVRVLKWRSEEYFGSRRVILPTYDVLYDSKIKLIHETRAGCDTHGGRYARER